MNRITIIGNLGNTPDIRDLSNGRVANLRIATNESYKDKNQERQTITEWHRVSVYVPFLIDRCEGLQKGQRVLVEGSLRTRKYNDNNGQERSVTEIVVRPYNGTVEPMQSNANNGTRGNNERHYAGSEPRASQARPPRPVSPSPETKKDNFVEDEIPF